MNTRIICLTGGTCVYLLLFVLPALLIYYLSYMPNNQWNISAKSTIGQIKARRVNMRVCMTLGSCIKTDCRVIPHDCFDGKVLTTYELNNVTYNCWLFAYLGEYDNVENRLEKYYPDNSKVKIYYNPDNPIDSRLFIKNNTGSYVAFLCIIITGSVLYVIFISYMAYRIKRDHT